MDEDGLREHVEAEDLVGLRRWLDGRPPHEVAAELARLDAPSMALPFRLLDKDRALEVFEELDPVHQQCVLTGLREKAYQELVEGMDPDDRARMLAEAPATVVRRVLAGLSPRERRSTAALLGYPDDSAGRVMTPEVVWLHPQQTVAEALVEVRTRGAEAETIYTLPVIDTGRRLLGVVSLRTLVLSGTEERVEQVAISSPSVAATDQAEAAARLMQEADLLGLPVVDSEGRLVGMLTVDDAIEVIEAADTEDAERQSAASPLGKPYLAASVFTLARSRLPWLLLLIVAATMTVNVLQFFEASLAEVTALALFIPLITGSGGNAGSQSATSIVRALAVGDVRLGDLPRVIWRESRVGLLLGLALALIGLLVCSLFAGWQLGLVVGISLIVVCTWAAIVGGGMPLLARKIGVDPAVVSAPMVTTLVDATALIIYFLTAHLILNV
ncbi:magnesium transporter [Actinoalloteichus hymeniacidonis]|uniref:Magnesium transporter MgtE n=1 Tax=Actinoalloteichus hymeniacidonis TaxID=340345 RepID=A0AAC9HT65_9PSEU|nr:magnesium transporter [Actinoalloteichus hymeniacidonis]AOS65217.1 Mg2+ transporter MgtE [Actinoalloteichus hymeniacidonis]MBB5906703.1 magnesium transporter [Actinoalloteichus hymeniacidonis]